MELIKKLNILVIDDEQEVRENLQHILERREHRVFTAADGAEGLAVCGKFFIDVVLADIVMPTMDGLEFLRKVHYVSPKTEVIVVTGQSTVERCVKAIEYGACGYLLKPVSIIDILNSISDAMKLHKAKEAMLEKAMGPAKKQ